MSRPRLNSGDRISIEEKRRLQSIKEEQSLEARINSYPALIELAGQIVFNYQSQMNAAKRSFDTSQSAYTEAEFAKAEKTFIDAQLHLERLRNEFQILLVEYRMMSDV